MPTLPPMTPVSAEEAETVDFVVCAPSEWPTPFVDNVETVCAHCGRAIMHRPHAPKRPPKICVVCATQLARPN